MAHGQAPGLSREAIASGLRALGLEAGSLVLVHSSLRSLGWVEGGAPPCAPDGPSGRLAGAGGFILLRGVTYDSNTSLHMVEELAGVPYHLQDKPAPARVARADGAWEEIPTRLHLCRWERDFPRVEPLLLEAGGQRTGMVGEARSRLSDARAIRELLVPLLQRDPFFLLTDGARAEYEQ